MVKLDFEKAYDSLDHTFLNNKMSEMGYCISTPILSVLVNVCSSRQFRIEKGLCQGDPLSPFLFNVAVEGLSALFRKAEAMGLMRGAYFGEGAVHVSHLKFVDDTILFLQSNEEYLMITRRILRCYEVASGLRINFQKSCVVKVCKSKESEFSSKDYFIEFKTVSLRGSGLFSTRVVDLSLSKQLCLVSHFTICRSLKSWSLLPKILRVFRGVSFGEMVEKREKCIWSSGRRFEKAVSGLFDHGSESAKILKEGLRVVVGRGDRARLWYDLVVDGMPLKEVFPRVFSLAAVEDDCVIDYGNKDGNVWI
ncbi:hypothetical protein Dsin_019525 [Dipteronia sinensis]|uniref:Reverse transcriptase domain-containing protein n=1 Tax=Dipteronia sinensis TaxID=43782 RepID=A0AAE0A827_9ROSI|nr:hypothetical protein Dsin_019525 [Dipteronia sinensis]